MTLECIWRNIMRGLETTVKRNRRATTEQLTEDELRALYVLCKNRAEEVRQIIAEYPNTYPSIFKANKQYLAFLEELKIKIENLMNQRERNRET